MRLHCAPGQVPDSLRDLIYAGTYELGERLLVQHAVTPGSRVLEIGSGLGLISILCSRIAGSGQVLSYEANPALADRIAANYTLNNLSGNVVIKAVTRTGTSVTFFQNENILSSSTLDRNLKARRITVQSDSLDMLIASHRPDVLVMDVEGGEIDLLLHTDLVGIAAMVVELHPQIVGQDQVEELVNAIRRQGFRLEQSRYKNALFVRDATR